MNKHDSIIMDHNSEKIEIDILLAPIISWCWSHGIRTLFCCQGNKNGSKESDLAYIIFDSDDAVKFARAMIYPRPSLKHIFEIEGDSQVKGTWRWGFCHIGDEDYNMILRFPHEDITKIVQRLEKQS